MDDINFNYNPKRFREDDVDRHIELIRSYPFATLISVEKDKPFLSHLPMLVEKTGSTLTLTGHMARLNPHWTYLKSKAECMVLFQGPHTYITPTWYQDPEGVPTWNYAVVHVHGKPEVIEDPATIEDILIRSVKQFETAESQPWNYTLEETFKQGLISEIVAFSIRATHTVGKFKLSQHRPKEESQRVIRHLQDRPDDQSHRIAEMMAQFCKIDR